MPLPLKPLESGGPQCLLVNGGASRRTFGWPTKIGNRGCNARQQPPFAALQHPASRLRDDRASRPVSLKFDSSLPDQGCCFSASTVKSAAASRIIYDLSSTICKSEKRSSDLIVVCFDHCGLAPEPLPTIIPALFTRPNAV